MSGEVELHIDTRGVPSRVCLNCDGEVFKILVKVDDDGEIVWNTSSGYCYQCKAPITIPLPETVEREEVEFEDE